jgi:excisionase family DNA binding protein
MAPLFMSNHDIFLSVCYAELKHMRREVKDMGNDAEKLSTFKEVMTRFKVSERTLRRWLHLGEIEAFHIGRQLRFEEREIKRFMDLRRRAAKRKAS